jgi:hypothetical protein
MEIDLLVLEGAPEPFDEDVVAPAALAVHADLDTVGLGQPREGGTRELGALIGVEDGRSAMARQRLFHGGNAECTASIYLGSARSPDDMGRRVQYTAPQLIPSAAACRGHLMKR